MRNNEWNYLWKKYMTVHPESAMLIVNKDHRLR